MTSEPGDNPGVVRGSGDKAVADAIERAKATADLNVPVLQGLPLPEDTANLRLGPDLDGALDLLETLP